MPFHVDFADTLSIRCDTPQEAVALIDAALGRPFSVELKPGQPELWRAALAAVTTPPAVVEPASEPEPVPEPQPTLESASESLSKPETPSETLQEAPGEPEAVPAAPEPLAVSQPVPPPRRGLAGLPRAGTKSRTVFEWLYRQDHPCSMREIIRGLGPKYETTVSTFLGYYTDRLCEAVDGKWRLLPQARELAAASGVSLVEETPVQSVPAALPPDEEPAVEAPTAALTAEDMQGLRRQITETLRRNGPLSALSLSQALRTPRAALAQALDSEQFRKDAARRYSLATTGPVRAPSL